MPASYATQDCSVFRGNSEFTLTPTLDRQTTSYDAAADSRSPGTNQQSKHEPIATEQMRDEFMEKLYAPLHQKMVDSLPDRHLAPDSIVRFEERGGKTNATFVEPWTGLKVATLQGMAMDARRRSSNHFAAGDIDASKVELDWAKTIARTLNSVTSSHAQRTMTPAQIKTDIHKQLVEKFGQAPTADDEEKTFDDLVETYNNLSKAGSKFDQARMNVALSHLLFATGEEAQQKQKMEEKTWMQQLQGPSEHGE